MNRKDFKQFHELITTELDEFANDLKLDIERFPLRLTNCWLNIYGKGHTQELHNHANSVISGIYYVKAPEECGALVIQSPYADSMFEAPPVANDPINLTQINIRPEEGLLILFRSYVKHAVKANHSKDERISIAFNATMDVL